MATPTYKEIVTALTRGMAKAVGKDAVILSGWQEAEPDASDIFVIHAVSPRGVLNAELGGREALAIHSGVYTITLSYPKGSAQKHQKSQEMAQRLVDTFYRLDLPAGDGCAVYAGEPYITNAGTTPDDRRALSVTVPWRTWAGGY